jgi:hypothetical protein
MVERKRTRAGSGRGERALVLLRPVLVFLAVWFDDWSTASYLPLLVVTQANISTFLLLVFSTETTEEEEFSVLASHEVSLNQGVGHPF